MLQGQDFFFNPIISLYSEDDFLDFMCCSLVM